MVCGCGTAIVKKCPLTAGDPESRPPGLAKHWPGSRPVQSNLKEIVMFIIVTYPWPVPSAHVELTGPNKLPSKAPARHGKHRDEHREDTAQPALAGAGRTR